MALGRRRLRLFLRSVTDASDHPAKYNPMEGQDGIPIENSTKAFGFESGNPGEPGNTPPRIRPAVQQVRLYRPDRRRRSRSSARRPNLWPPTSLDCELNSVPGSLSPKDMAPGGHRCSRRHQPRRLTLRLLFHQREELVRGFESFRFL